MVTDGWFASWMSVDVTYAISGFLPMYIESRVHLFVVVAFLLFQI